MFCFILLQHIFYSIAHGTTLLQHLNLTTFSSETLLHKRQRAVIISNFTKPTTAANLERFSFQNVLLMYETNYPKQLIIAHYRPK